MERDRITLGPPPVPPRTRAALARVRTWLFDGDDGALSPPRRAALILGRVVWLVLRSFSRDRLQMRAASLSFSTLLAFVPALALAFAAAKATGLFATVRDQTLLPFIEETLGSGDGESSPGVEALHGTAIALVQLVEGTSLTGLGVTGLFVLVWAILRVVRGVDESFRNVFEHRGPLRPLGRRVRAFLVVALVTPLGLAYAVVSASFSHGGAASLVEAWVNTPVLRDSLLFILPPCVVTLTLYVLYKELPDAEVRSSSAWFGAAAAGLAWYAAQFLHVRLQVGLARWNAIYSGFGAFPVLLASIQISWVIVLVGAQLVAMHQHSTSLRVLASGARRDFASLSLLGMQAAVALAGHTVPVTARALASELKADLVSVRLVLDALLAHGLVSRVVTSGGRHYALAVEASLLRTSDILSAIEQDPDADLPWKEAAPAVRAAITEHRRAADTSEHNLTVAEIRARGERA